MGFLICSCSGSQNYNPVEVGYACEFGGDSARIEMQRFDFNLPNFFFWAGNVLNTWITLTITWVIGCPLLGG
jgi:hypothetical protein